MSDHATPARSRAILIGVAAYDDPAFTPIPAARNSLTGMRDLLADPTLCGWPHETITVLDDPAHPGHLARQIRDLARDTSDVLLLYYVGHGQLTPRGELCLTVTDTVAADPDYTGLLFPWIKDALRESPARVKLVILDCCYAGQAIEALSSPDDIADLAHTNGSYTLTATTRNQTAHVSPLDQQETTCTSFTGQLIALARAGIPDGPPELTLNTLYPYLRQRLVALGLPQPNQRGTDTADRYVFATNAHHLGVRPPAGEAAAWIDRAGTLCAQGHYFQAEAAYREATRLDPGNAWAHTGLGHALNDQERHDEAEAAFREAIRLGPNDAYVHRNLGVVLLGQDRLAEAEAAYREAIRL
ncbi:MAG TPA: tetratricopeptide repeat protein, partial [Pseudonocardiaceae bacterium]|nr:tetratricopeptide repeat protein [Pseudonocardiaceae bacterium]